MGRGEGGKRFEDIILKRWARQGCSEGQWSCVLYLDKRKRAKSRNDLKESIGFKEK
jgi:hypothetical protein